MMAQVLGEAGQFQVRDKIQGVLKGGIYHHKGRGKERPQ